MYVKKSVFFGWFLAAPYVFSQMSLFLRLALPIYTRWWISSGIRCMVLFRSPEISNQVHKIPFIVF